MELPNEILIKIFKYLSLSDRKEASLVCIRWFTNINTATFQRKMKLVLTKKRKNRPPPMAFHPMARSFVNLEIRGYCRKISEETAEFLKKRCENISTLTITDNIAPFTSYPFLSSLRKIQILNAVCLYQILDFFNAAATAVKPENVAVHIVGLSRAANIRLPRKVMNKLKSLKLKSLTTDAIIITYRFGVEDVEDNVEIFKISDKFKSFVNIFKLCWTPIYIKPVNYWTVKPN